MKYNKNDLQFKKKYLKYKKKYVLLKKRKQLLKQKGGMFGLVTSIGNASSTAIAVGAGYYTYNEIKSGVKHLSNCLGNVGTRMLDNFLSDYFNKSYSILETYIGITNIKKKNMSFLKSYPQPMFLSFNTLNERKKDVIKELLGMFMNDKYQDTNITELTIEINSDGVFVLNDFFLSHLHFLFLIRKKIESDILIVKTLLGELIDDPEPIKKEKIYNNLYSSLQIYLFKKMISKTVMEGQCTRFNFLDLSYENWGKTDFNNLIPPTIYKYFQKFKSVDWFKYYYKTIIVLILRIINLKNDYSTHFKIFTHFKRKYDDFKTTDTTIHHKIKNKLSEITNIDGIYINYKDILDQEYMQTADFSTFPILKQGNESVGILYKTGEAIKKEQCTQQSWFSTGWLFQRPIPKPVSIQINLVEEFEIKDIFVNRKIQELQNDRRRDQQQEIQDAISDAISGGNETEFYVDASDSVDIIQDERNYKLSVIDRYNSIIQSDEQRLRQDVLKVSTDLDFQAFYRDDSIPTKKQILKKEQDGDDKYCVIMPSIIGSPYYVRIHQDVLNGNYSIEDQMDGCHKAIEDVALSLLPFIQDQTNQIPLEQLTLNN